MMKIFCCDHRGGFQELYQTLILSMIFTLKSINVLTILIAIISLQVSAKIVVHGPSKLAHYFKQKYGDKGIPFSVANYGQVPYGKSISGVIGIPTVLQDCISQTIPDMNAAQILLVQRNDCTFTQKSLNVQKEGGKVAIVMDSYFQNPNSIVMSDDGRGYLVKIPTILIKHQDGQILLQNIHNNIEITISFETIKWNIAQLSIWLDITNHKDIVFMRKFRQYFDKIKSFVNLSVGYPVSICSSNCSVDHCYTFPVWQSTVNYCRYPHANDYRVYGGGRSIIKEQILQYLVFKKSSSLWWSYLIEFDEKCIVLSQYYKCGRTILQGKDYIQLKKWDIDKEMSNIMNNTNGSLVELLGKWYKDKVDKFIVYYPALIVNRVVYRGNLQPVDIYDLICQSLSPTPNVCLDQSQTKGSKQWIWILASLALMAIYLLFLCCCYRRRIKAQLNKTTASRVNTLVSQYITMYQKQKFESDAPQLQKELNNL